MAGDTVIAAFFEGDNRARRKTALQAVESQMKAYVEKGDSQIANSLEAKRVAIRKAEKPIVPFHWEIEFPEVFQLDANLRPQSGFDAIVGNPPFAGKNTLIDGNSVGYVDWLKGLHVKSHGNSDLVAHFFRRAFNLLKPSGSFGLIATNTIGQGDTRSTGLRWICTHNGTIYRARKRRSWPGEAAVSISVVHVHKGEMAAPYWLNGKPVERITAYLFHDGPDEDAAALHENEGRSFAGSFLLGPGFTFDDSAGKNEANPISLMHDLIRHDPRNAERIFPYIGGEEVNDSPSQLHHRYVINFGNMTEQEARRWPELMDIIERKVKPYRLTQNRESRAKYWWRYGEVAPALYQAIFGMRRILVTSYVTQHLAFVFVPAGMVYAITLAILRLETYAAFSVLQSRCHEIWARFFGSSLEDRLRYAPSDCFEPFPFPEKYEANITLEETGQAYYRFRVELMARNNEGLTKTYNKFHNPSEHSSDIKKLRELHASIDRAVLDAYGWSDINPVCDFFPEFEEDEEPDEQESNRTRTKKYRYRWPDEIHDEVLARLLALNQQRAAVPQIETALPASEKQPKSKTKKSEKTDESNLSLFESRIK